MTKPEIRYHLIKDMPKSGNWSDPSDWTMLTDINGVRVGHITLPKEQLLERLTQAHGAPGLAWGNGELSLCGVWPDRDLTYSVSWSREQGK